MDPSKLAKKVAKEVPTSSGPKHGISLQNCKGKNMLIVAIAGADSIENLQILGSEDQTSVIKLIQTEKQEELINKMNEQIQTLMENQKTLMEKQDKLDKGFAVLLSAINKRNTFDSAKSKTGIITEASAIKNKKDSSDEIPDLDDNGTAQVSSPSIKSRLRSSK